MAGRVQVHTNNVSNARKEAMRNSITETSRGVSTLTHAAQYFPLPRLPLGLFHFSIFAFSYRKKTLAHTCVGGEVGDVSFTLARQARRIILSHAHAWHMHAAAYIIIVPTPRRFCLLSQFLHFIFFMVETWSGEKNVWRKAWILFVLESECFTGGAFRPSKGHGPPWEPTTRKEELGGFLVVRQMAHTPRSPFTLVYARFCSLCIRRRKYGCS